MTQDTYNIFVTVGLPDSEFAAVERLVVLVDDTTGETPIQAAKKLRKLIADAPHQYGFAKGTKLNPADLYYEIYQQRNSEFPFAASLNSPYCTKNNIKKEEWHDMVSHQFQNR